MPSEQMNGRPYTALGTAQLSTNACLPLPSPHQHLWWWRLKVLWPQRAARVVHDVHDVIMH